MTRVVYDKRKNKQYKYVVSGIKKQYKASGKKEVIFDYFDPSRRLRSYVNVHELNARLWPSITIVPYTLVEVF